MGLQMQEAILEPDLPIVDAHHHLWHHTLANGTLHPVIARRPRYLIDEMSADLNSGHRIRATVFVQCRAMYRSEGPEYLKPVGETEFANGAAAMSASGAYGPTRICAGIVGFADLTVGDAIDEALESHLAASPRFRGIRQSSPWDADPGVRGLLSFDTPGLYLSDDFCRGYARLSKYGLSFDAWLLEPQLPDVIDLAKRFPETPIVLDHVGTPLGVATYRGKREERFSIWRRNVRALAKLPNVTVKLGGLGGDFCNFPSFEADPPARPEQLAGEWGPYLESCIEAFGPERCMFESNFPVDGATCDYATLWNAFKVFAKAYSADEKAHLFAGTATRFYRLNLPTGATG